MLRLFSLFLFLGCLSHAVALAMAEEGYAGSRVEQDGRYEWDCERSVKTLKCPKAAANPENRMP